MMCQKCLNNFCIVRAKKSPLSPLWKEGLKSAPEKIPPLKKGNQGGFRCGL